ncbi:MAG: hypothetical protein JXD23_06145 [Spirochaetales bacterium]|nr:hypothetical protein [Spirochaetales bacterium]
MRKNLFIFMAALFVSCAARGFAVTVYLYLEESCNGKHGLFLTAAREGVFDVLFGANHIVFDDTQDKGLGTKILADDLAVPLSVARRGGADYLLTIVIDSTIEKMSAGPQAPEKIDSRGTYALFEAGTGRRIARGECELNNRGKEEGMDRNKLGFDLGREMGKKAASVLRKKR